MMRPDLRRNISLPQRSLFPAFMAQTHSVALCVVDCVSSQ